MDKKTANKRSDRILWLDLEMTGLDPDKDMILEVGAIITDWSFKEIDSYHGIIKQNKLSLNKRLKANAIFWDANPTSRDGLTQQNSQGKSSKIIEQELIDLIDANFKLGIPVILAGNSVHMDRRFIVKNWKKFDSRLHYRMLDVSAWKVVFENKYKLKFAKPDMHRALDDIRGSIIELQYYLARLK